MGRRSLALAVCLGAGFSTLIDQGVFTLAVPSLTAGLHAGRVDVQWLLSAYSLAFGLALIPAGRYGDLVGRRRLLILGLAVFGLGGIASGLAAAPWQVIVARLVQGAGAGAISAQVLGLIQDLYDGHARARALGLYGVAAGLSGVVGPLVGGALVGSAPGDDAWRPVVLLSVPFAAATLVLGAVVLPKDDAPATTRPERRPRVDAVGLALLAVTTLGLMLPSVITGLPATALAALPALAVVALLCFLTWERRAGAARPADIVLPPALVTARGFVTGSLVATFWFGAGQVYTVTLTLYLLSALGIPAIAVALLMVSNSIGFVAASALSWRIVRRFGIAVVSVALGLDALLIGAMAVALPHVGRAPLLAAIPVFHLLLGLTSGMTDAPNRSETLVAVPDGSRGVAAGFLQLSQRLSAAVCVAIGSGIALSAAGAVPTAATVAWTLAGAAGLIAVAFALSILRLGESAAAR